MNEGTDNALAWYAGQMLVAGWALAYCDTCDVDVWVADGTCPSCGGTVAL